MPKATARMSTRTKNTTTKASTVTPVKKTSKPKKSTKKKEEDVSVISDVEEVSKEVSKEVTEEVSVETPAPKQKRKQADRESILASMDELIESIETEITRLRESPNKLKGVKFLRSLNKRLKTLRSQSTRVMKQRPKVVRKRNPNSGFLKPVRISTEMAKFTGWNATELRSRVDVTKYICNYIKENDLQNPKDRRQILADTKLSKLLNYDSKTAENPLTYYRIQTYMKPHFPKDEKKDSK